MSLVPHVDPLVVWFCDAILLHAIIVGLFVLASAFIIRTAKPQPEPRS